MMYVRGNYDNHQTDFLKKWIELTPRCVMNFGLCEIWLLQHEYVSKLMIQGKPYYVSVVC
jgi:hypothetical protein